MDPFSILSNLPSLPSLPSSLLQRRTHNKAANAVVQTSPLTPPRKHSQALPPHAPTTHTPSILEQQQQHQQEQDQKACDLELTATAAVARPRNNPQAILPELENNAEDYYLRLANQQREEEGEDDSNDNDNDNDNDNCNSLKSNLHSIHTTIPSRAADTNVPSGDAASATDLRKTLYRHTSLHTVHTTASTPNADSVPTERASIDTSSLDRARVLKPSPADTVQATTMVSKPRPMHLRHIRSSSTPSMGVSSPLFKPSATTIVVPNIPAVVVPNADLVEEGQQQQQQAAVDQDQVDSQCKLPLPEALSSKAPSGASASELAVAAALASLEIENERYRAASFLATPPSTSTLSATQESPTALAVDTPSAPEKAVMIADLEPVAKSSATVISSSPVAPAPSPAAAASPSAPTTTTSSFLSSWHGRSRAMIPSIPRPSPMMPFRAARSVVSSVTSVGTGFLPSMEQLGSIPVAGRILTHPVMDSTLSYIATKASERGINLAALTGGVDPRMVITPEDAPYRKLNKKLLQQAMTLAVLAIQKEEESKAMDDEAGDDAFELYLGALHILLHSLPFETCDPLRREAFTTQLRSFLEDHLGDQTTDATYLCDTGSSKRLRRRRRRRHREHHDQAATLIQQHTTLAAEDQQAFTLQRGRQRQLRKQRRDQHAKQQQALRKEQLQLQQQLKQQEEKEAKSRKQQQAKNTSATSSPALRPVQQPTKSSSSNSSETGSKSSRRRQHRHRSVSNVLAESVGLSLPGVAIASLANANSNAGGTGIGDTIISTAVHSAIRLKQSPIPDVVKTCLRTSRTIFHKVDERFRLQDKAWELSKQSLEKAIELDEQYAIHEVVTETVFATLTGLVKAGIAYKETPSYSSVRAASADGKIEALEAAAAATATDGAARSHNPQEILEAKKQQRLLQQQSGKGKKPSAKDLKQNDAKAAATKSKSSKKALDSDLGSSFDDNSEDSDFDSDVSDSEMDSAASSSKGSSYCASSDNDDGAEDEEEPIELNQQTLRSETSSRASATTPSVSAYGEQVREKIDMLMALKGAASLIVGNL